MCADSTHTEGRMTLNPLKAAYSSVLQTRSLGALCESFAISALL